MIPKSRRESKSAGKVLAAGVEFDNLRAKAAIIPSPLYDRHNSCYNIPEPHRSASISCGIIAIEEGAGHGDYAPDWFVWKSYAH
jgi:hypothetical protein